MKKKLSSLFLSIILLIGIILTPVPVIAENPYSLVITEVCRDTTGKDLAEAIELLNVSNKSLDLYNYTIWRYHSSKNNWDEINNAAPVSKSQRMNITDTQGNMCWSRLRSPFAG